MNSREELINFVPKHEFFIGIDSDGTAFDSMNIKHQKAFLPAALKIWALEEYTEKLKELWDHINLFSEDRGINRFPGLLMVLEKLPEITGRQNDFDCSPLKDFLEHTDTLSNAALKDYMASHPGRFLDTVYQWSLEADRLFEKYTQGLLPYTNCEPALQVMREKADIMVISSASGKGLDKDWSFSGLSNYVSLIAGQEIGNKKVQLKLGSFGKYPAHKVLMIGDAPGDLEAARSVEALFYPIVPGHEEESWIKLREEGLSRFFGGTYQGDYQDGLTKEFFKSLQ
jgi:phosphoglycolate phosphatase-like HAD superfamily hydrolase